jgi:hypothetical protein
VINHDAEGIIRIADNTVTSGLTMRTWDFRRLRTKPTLAKTRRNSDFTSNCGRARRTSFSTAGMHIERAINASHSLIRVKTISLPSGKHVIDLADGCLMELWVTLDDFEGRVLGRKLEIVAGFF